MKIEFLEKEPKNIRIINFYTEEKDKKNDENNFLYTNFRLEKKDKEISIINFAKLMRKSINRAKMHKIEKIAFDFDKIKEIEVKELSEENRIKLFIKNIFLAEYVFDKYKTKKEGRIKEVKVFGKFSETEKKIFEKSLILTEGIENARNFANTPAQDMTPTIFSEKIKEMFDGISNISIKIFEDEETKKLGMGLYDAVGKGSSEKSKFIIIEYKGDKNNKEVEMMVGKGICYDTGGLSLKPSDSMLEMHMDMTGASVVANALYVLAKNKVNKNLVTIIPAVENGISGNAYRPGDILTAYNKTTVEIKNTDAEGRLVLADAISYGIEKYNPIKLIDVATLTGASLVAVGQKASVIMTNSKEMERELRDLGNKIADRVWPLPLWDEFANDIESNFADIANLGKSSYGGTVTAGMFLKHFIGDKKIDWTHIDIAPRMESADGDELAKGATGEPVDLLVEYFKK